MRERLAERYQETHSFTASFRSYAKTNEGSNVACFGNVYLDDAWMTDHVWIHRSKQMKNLDLQPGDRVRFEARVGRYVKSIVPRPHTEAPEWDYCLEKIRDVVIVQRHTEGD